MQATHGFSYKLMQLKMSNLMWLILSKKLTNI